MVILLSLMVDPANPEPLSTRDRLLAADPTYGGRDHYPWTVHN